MMFTKQSRNGDDVVEPADLPAGFDDENSDYYVHPELREHYQQIGEPGAVRFVAKADELIREAAARVVRANYPRVQPTDGYQQVADVAADIKKAELSDYLALAQHQLRLTDAITAKAGADQREANRVAHRAMFTCPTCGEYDAVANGPVKVRQLDGGKVGPNSGLPYLTSCHSCFTEWVAQTREARARVVLPNGQTRRELISNLIP